MGDNEQRGETVRSQTNIAGNQYNAQGGITVVKGDMHVHLPPPPLLNLHQISEPTKDFVGREAELKTLLAAFEGAGQGAVILGVRGMGGMGKTELAHVVAKEFKGRFPDAQIAMNLRGVTDDASTQPATAVEALQHVVRSFRPDVELPDEVDVMKGRYRSVLEGKRVLLLMDNARDAQQLAPLAPLPDGCALIVTSRQHFALSGMGTPINLTTLPPEEARKLLLEICPRIGEHAENLAERCACLPLALRLAASALKTHETLGVEDYVKRLASDKERLAALDEFKDSTDVERGISASLAISYDLLDKGLQRFWRALSVFPGDFDVAAAGSVWQLEDVKRAEKPLGDLCAASMAQWEEATGRFRLHDLARDYARARLSEEERAEDAQRHAAHYAGVLRRTNELHLEGGDGVLQGLALFDREWDNIRSGQVWAAAHWKADNTAAKLCSDYPGAGAYCLNLRLHPRDKIAWLDAAIKAARKTEDRSAEGRHLVNLGNAYVGLGEPREAIECHEQALAISREIGDRRGEGNALDGLANIYYHCREPGKAIELLGRGLDIAREIGDRRGEERALCNLGNVYRFRDPDRAIKLYKRSLRIAREIHNRLSEGNTLGNLGSVYADLGEVHRALDYHKQNLAIAREFGDRHSIGMSLNNVAWALSRTGRREEAIARAEEAVEILEQLESPDVANARQGLKQLRQQTNQGPST